MIEARPPWDAWDPEPPALPPGARALLGAMLKARPRALPRLDPARVELTAGRLSPEDLDALRGAVGHENVRVDDDARRQRLGGKSTPDLLARRRAGMQTAPDAVVLPAGHDEVQAVLTVCDERRIAVVPFGGGTSVVGGVSPAPGPHRAVVSLDLSRMTGMRGLDETSLLATFGAGTTGPRAEALLSEHGLTLGHFPQSYAYATLGGFAATRSSGQASRGYGRFDDLVHSLRAATPVGGIAAGRAPASAAGPDLREVLLGSEGAFGVITEVTVRVRPAPSRTEYEAWTFPDFSSGATAVRKLTQAGIAPAVLRLSDETETRVNAAMGGHLTRLSGALAVTVFEGEDAAHDRARTAILFARHGARSRGEDPARSWERGRFSAPGLRDTLLDIGVLAETLETAATWAALPALKTAVTGALTTALGAGGARPFVLCHISHVYPAGASLYFTVVAPLADDPVGEWGAAKDAASRAILAAGGTISHHHAVGSDHRPFLPDEIGPVGVRVLRAVKDALDPHGIMNPATLVP